MNTNLYVIVRDGFYYAGFLEGRPVWDTMRRPETQFDGDTAEVILRQLLALGYSGCELKLYQKRLRAQGRRGASAANADA